MRGVGQSREAALVLSGGPVSACDLIGRTAEAESCNRRIGQIPGQVSVFGTAAALVSTGVVHVGPGLETATSFEYSYWIG